MIHFQCPGCGKGIKVGDGAAGKDGKCPACGAAVHVPDAPGTVAQGPPPLKPDQGAAAKPASTAPEPPGESVSVADEILKFKNLMDQGIISPDEFETKKRQLLDLSPPPQVLTDANKPKPAKTSQPAHVSQAESALGRPRSSSGLGIASLVVGILSFFTCWIPVIGLPFGALGICLGAAGLVRKRSGIGCSIAGTAVSSVALLASLGLVLAGYGVARLQRGDYKDLARSQIIMFEGQLDAYRLHIGSYPTTNQGLQALRTPPADLKIPYKWRGPYAQEAIPMDPWGNPYQYESFVNPEQVRIWSWGADGADGTEDDVASDQ